MTPNPHDAPIACTLGGTAHSERVAWIARLNQDGLRRHRRYAASLELVYDPRVRDRAYELVRMESACCAFLAFRVDESADAVRVTITVPERAADDADTLLAPFLEASAHLPPRQPERGREGGSMRHAAPADEIPLEAHRPQGPARFASAAAVTTAAGALACGVCCVLPFALPAVAAAGAGSALAWLARAQGAMTLLASAIVASAWIAVAAHSRRTRRRSAPATLSALAVATTVLLVAIAWPRVEPTLIRLLGGRP